MKPNPKSDLASRYRINIFVAAIAVFIIAAMVSIYQYFTQRKQELIRIERIVTDRANEVDAIVNATSDRIRELHFIASDYLSREDELPRSMFIDYIDESKDKSFFSTDEGGPDIDYEDFGTVYGRGSFHDRPWSFYNEINASLYFLPAMRAANKTTPHMTWIYYMSARRFLSANPGAVVGDFLTGLGVNIDELYADIYSSDVWKKALSANNLNNEPYWTGIYLDAGGMGLMTTYGIPVIINKKLRGTIAGDVTLDFLSTSMRKSDYEKGTFLVANNLSQVLGSSSGTGNKVLYIKDYLPDSLKDIDIDLPNGAGMLNHHKILGYNLFTVKLTGAPWHILFILPETDLMKEVMPSFLVNFTIVIGLFAFLIITYRLLERVYVKPAISLVELIENEANNLHSQLKKIHPLWRCWFDQVREIFRESRELNAELEKRVEERTAELELAKSEAEAAGAEAEEANRAKSRFLANMSHELRTPLNAILGFAQLMTRKNQPPENQLENLAVIRQSGEHLLSLINDVLDMSKTEAGRSVLELRSFDLFSTIKDLEEMFKVQTEGKGIQFIVEPAPGIPRFIRTDERKLRQTLINLLGNAAKFTHKGTILLRVSNPSESEKRNKGFPSSRLIFEVRDTGSGIPEGDMERIFDPFVQVQDGQKNGSGTGLGLSICRQFVHLMGGDITVESRVGEGSAFRFDITIEQTDFHEVRKPEDFQRVTGLSPGQPDYRILIVEDNDVNRRLLRTLLMTTGFKVREATNGLEAINLYKSWHPHLIWMDMQMPVMDGFKATKVIKESIDGMDTVVIALTASVFEEDREKVFAAGCDDFVRKPFREERIFELMSRYLGTDYIYDETNEEEYRLKNENHSGKTMVEAMAALPDDLKNELRDSVERLNIEDTIKIIERIKEYNKPLSHELTGLVKEVRLDILQSILNGVEK